MSKKHNFAVVALMIGAITFNAAAERLSPAEALLPKPREITIGKGVFRETDPAKRVYSEDKSLPKEGYALTVAADGVRIAFADADGRCWAERTLEQLKDDDGGYACCSIKDWPEFHYRGVLVDTARHFYPLDEIKRILVQMSEVKLNVFHWHFIEAGKGWRLELPGYPKLTEKEPHFSKADLEEIVRFAAERRIRVIPELEMPGHNNAASFYPELGHGGKGGDICVANPKTIKFFKDLIDYAAAVFPDPLVHFGGDEVGYGQWKKCPDCQAKMKSLGLKTEAELQAHFMSEMAAHIKSKGKTPLGWSDMLLQLTDNMHDNGKGYWTGYSVQKNLSKDIVITAWYGDWECEGGCGAVAANMGYKTIQYPANHCYFDYRQGLAGDIHKYAPTTDVTLESAYLWDPCSDVKPEFRKNILGVACANWSEAAVDLETLEWKLWPRGFATAEVGWTCPKNDLKAKSSPAFAEFNRRAQHLAAKFRERGWSAAHEKAKGPRKAVFGPGQQEVHIKAICEFAGKVNPKVLVFETAEGDAESEIAKRVAYFKAAGAEPEAIRMYKEKIDAAAVRRKIREADIIWFGCGNSEWLRGKIDFYYLEDAIKAAYRDGTVLCGNSAGSLMQSYGGLNDFTDGRYDFIKGMGIIRAYFVPHYQSELFGAAKFDPRLAEETDPGTPDEAWAVENGAGVFFVNEKPEVRRVVGKGESPAAKAYHFVRKDGKWKKSVVSP